MTDNKQNDPTTVEDDPRVIAGSLDLVDVTKTYAGRRGTSQKAVDSISLHIKAGTFTTLLGPSGCGKTTTLRMIAGFEEVTSGEITLDGEPLTSTPANKRPMSMVFQSYALFSHLTVEESVGFGLKLKKVARQERDDRVATSLRTEALTMSDTIVVMSAGRIEQVGTPAEIYHRPANRFVAGFLGTSNFIEGTVSEVLHEEAHSGRYRISTTLADIECDGVPGLEEAQSTAIVIRAEDLVVGEERSDSLRIPGTIVSSAFDGDVINYVVDTPCGRLQGRAPGTADVRATGHETDCAVDSALM